MQSPKNQTKIFKADQAKLDVYLLQQQQQQQQQQSKLKQQSYQLPAFSLNKNLTTKERDQNICKQNNYHDERQTSMNSFFHHQNHDDNSQNSSSFIANDQLPSIVQIQRKLLAFFYIYATLIVSLYLTYAIYCYYQHTVAASSQQQQPKIVNNNQESGNEQQLQLESSLAQKQPNEQQQKQIDLEQKFHLLERYIEVIALDLEETKNRLREREKCSCPMSCSFNGTIFQDGQKWQQKCDNCICQGGKITCSPRKCPKLNCDNPIKLPGQCCPICMKNCKLNKTIIKHGQNVKSNDFKKQCKCNDGLIKCETIKQQQQQQQQQQLPIRIENKLSVNEKAQNKTMEYLKSIIEATPNLIANTKVT